MSACWKDAPPMCLYEAKTSSWMKLWSLESNLFIHKICHIVPHCRHTGHSWMSNERLIELIRLGLRRTKPIARQLLESWLSSTAMAFPPLPPSPLAWHPAIVNAHHALSLFHLSASRVLDAGNAEQHRLQSMMTQWQEQHAPLLLHLQNSGAVDPDVHQLPANWLVQVYAVYQSLYDCLEAAIKEEASR